MDLFNRNPSDILRRLVTIDETWIHDYPPESKQQAKQWVGPSGTAPKRADTTIAGKVMTSVFLLKIKCIFLQDNAPARKSIKAIAKINEIRLELLPHPPYSLDMAPSDFY